MSTRISIVLFIVTIAVTPVTWAAYQNPASITEIVKKFVASGIDDEKLSRFEIEVQQPDKRLLLPQCKSPLDATVPNGDFSATYLSVTVRCTDQSGWSLYVPVTIQRYAPVAVTTKTLKRGDVIRTSDLDLREQRLDGNSKLFVLNPNEIAGFVVNRNLIAGTPVTLNAVKQPSLVKRGEQVVIFAKSAGIMVKMAGTALMDGTIGQVVRVKNLSSNRTIEARVVDQATVEVKL